MAYSGGAGLGHPGPGPGGASPPKPGQPSRPAVGSKAGPHGAIIAPYGARMPAAKAGFSAIGTGRGGWIYKPNAGAAGGAKAATGKGKGGGGMPASPYSKSEIASATALADAQTKGPLAELAAQMGANNAQTTGAIKLTGGYLNSLGGFARQGVTDQQNISQGLNTSLGLIGGGQQSALQGIGQNAQTALSRYTPGDPSTSAPAMQALTSELARQQALGAQQTTAFKTAGALQGANYSGLAASALGSDALAGTQALKGIAQSGTVKNEPLSAKQAALHAQRGALYSTDLAKVHQQNIANDFAAKGLGLKQQGLALTAAQDAARNSLTASAQKLTARGQDITAAHNAATEALTASGQQITAARNAANAAYQQSKTTGKTPAGGKPLSSSLNSKALGQISKAVGMIHEAQASFGKPGGAQRGNVRNLLASKTGYPNYILDAAFEVVGYGALSPSTAAYLHSIGIRGGGYKVGANNIASIINPF